MNQVLTKELLKEDLEILMTPEMIFVFGSNLSGIHGAGAARYAHTFKQAKWGVGEGPTGRCYALPTKGLSITFMDLEQVEVHANTFMRFADRNPDKDFQLTQVGCGLGGFTKEQIAPLFIHAARAGSNVYFDTAWKDLLPDTAKFWGTF